MTKRDMKLVMYVAHNLKGIQTGWNVQFSNNIPPARLLIECVSVSNDDKRAQYLIDYHCIIHELSISANDVTATPTRFKSVLLVHN